MEPTPPAPASSDDNDDDAPAASLTRGTLRAVGVALRRVMLGGAGLVLGGVAFATAAGAPESAPFVLGLLMLASAAIQALDTLTTASGPRRRTGYFSAATSAATGALLLAWGDLTFRALAVVLGFSWVSDGVGKLWAVAAGGTRKRSSRSALLFDGVINLLIGLCVAVRWPVSGSMAVFIAVGLRLLATGWSILLGRDAAGLAAEAARDADPDAHPDELLGIAPSPTVATMRHDIEEDERHRWSADRMWLVTLLLTFFAIHVGRMEADWDLVGMISPAVAIVGDVVFALFFAYVLVVPLRVAWRFLTRPIERVVWRRRLARGEAATGKARRRIDRLLDGWLAGRMRFSIELDRAWRSPAAALRRGLQLGLPPTAVLIALAPLLGVSWYFNTESYATAAWEHWAAHRADDWRTAMIAAVVTESGATDVPSAGGLFQVRPAGLDGGGDFSFVLIGDTGEGDASQHVLRDGFLALGARDDVKFLVVCSDVIYPQGAMKDYEPKFYLPFKGFSKPIYAIPGNHDWYDALEAFSANFFEPRAARAAMRARRAVDAALTTTTEARVERMIAEAARLRQAYGVRNGAQHAPFFEIQTSGFALIAIDSGILRRIDDEQLTWLKAALERARGKFTVVIPGHPFYAGGRYVPWDEDDPYRAVHALLREHGVDLVVAGDTHDFEFYREPYVAVPATPTATTPSTAARSTQPASSLKRADQNEQSASPSDPAAAASTTQPMGAQRSMLHLVNGGGGAYISIGTALAFPPSPPTPDCGFYPRTDAVIRKLDVEVPFWKQPLWWWVKQLGAWPSSPEVLAAAFASNRAPFHQSFLEVRVERSAGRVRVIVHGVDGPLRWHDVQLAASTTTPPPRAGDLVEFVLPMPMPR